MRTTVLAAASVALLTVALPQVASAAPSIGAETLKSAVETTSQVEKAGYYYRRHYRPYRYYRPYYYNY
jgi:hypothetical protein